MAYPWNENEYTADELRSAAGERGLTVTGTKADLVARLNDYDKPADEPNPDDIKPADQDDVPSLDEKSAELPDSAKTGAMRRNEALDALRAAERADVESGNYGAGSEMAKWHERYSPSRPDSGDVGEA